MSVLLQQRAKRARSRTILAAFSELTWTFLWHLQNPLLAASNAATNGNGVDDDKLSDYVPESRDLSVSRAVSLAPVALSLGPLCFALKEPVCSA